MRVTIFLVVLILAACQSAPATEVVITVPSTFSPSETPIPSPTFTQIPTILPTPTVSPAELRRRANPICENAFYALVETGPLTRPLAVLKKMTYEENSVWELAHQLPHVGSLSASEVQTLFCISEARAQAGTYTDGSPAYQLFWDIRAVSWPGGRVIGKNSFTGSAPPKTNVVAASSTEGSFPYSDFAAWVFSEVEHPDFIHFTYAVTTVAISPVNDLAAFGASVANQIVDREYQARIFFFRASNMQIISAVDGDQGMVILLAFSPDGKILASGGFDLFVKFWEVPTGHLLGQVNIGDTPNSLAFSPDGTTLAVASNLDVAFMDVSTMQIAKSLQGAGGKNLVYSPDGAQLYVNSQGSIKIIHPEANIVALAFPDPFALVPTVSVAADGSVIGVTYETPETVDGFALSPDGEQIISYTMDRSVEQSSGARNVQLATWDATTGKYLREITFSGATIHILKFSPDGNVMAFSIGNEIWIWDTANVQVKRKLTGHAGDVIDLNFTPDGTNLLSASSDGTIRVWPVGE